MIARLIFFVCLSMAVSSLPVRAADDLDLLIGRVMAAYGGADIVAGAKASRQTGHTVAKRHGGAEGRTVRAVFGHRKFRISISYPGLAREIRALDGDQAWRDSKPVGGPMAGAIRLQGARLALPGLLNDLRQNIVDQGLLTSPSGKEWRVLQITLDKGLLLFIQIEPATGLIRWAKAIVETPSMGAMEFATEYKDHKRFNGLLVATREEHWAMRSQTGHTVLEKVEIFDKMSDQEFRP